MSLGARAIVAYAVLSTLFSALLVVGTLAVPTAAERTDWMSYQAAARQVLAGNGSCVYEPPCQVAAQRELTRSRVAITRGLPYNNPPPLAMLVLPLALLPLGVALAIWIMLGLLAFLIGAWCLFRVQARCRLVVALLALSAWPVVTAVLHGQVTLLVAAVLAGSAALTLQGRALPAGALLGGAILKPTLLFGFAVWLMVTRRWGQLMVCGAVALGLLALSAFVVTPGELLAYPGYALGQLSDNDAAGIHVEQMVNWRAAATWVGGDLPGVVTAAGGWILTAAIAAAIWLRLNGPIGIAAALIATPLLVPHANQHDAVLGVVAWVMVLSNYRRGWIVATAVVMHATLWAALLISAVATAQLLVAALLVSLLVVAVLAFQEHRQGPHAHAGGGGIRLIGQRPTVGSAGVVEG